MRKLHNPFEYEEQFRINLVANISFWLAIVVPFGAFLRHLVSPLHNFVIVTFGLSSLLLFWSFYIAKYKRDVVLSATLFSIALYIFPFVSGLGNGGLTAPITILLVVQPLISAVLGGSLAPKVSLALSIISVFTLLFLERLGYVTPPVDLPTLNKFKALLYTIVSTVIYFLGQYFYNSKRSSDLQLIYERQFVEKILNTTPTGIILIEEDGLIEAINGKSLHFLGQPINQDGVGLNFYEILPDKYIEPIKYMIAQTIHRYIDGQFEMKIEDAEKTIRWLQLHSTAFNDGGQKKKCVITIVDLTEERFQSFLKSFHSTIMGLIAKRTNLNEIQLQFKKEIASYDPNLVVVDPNPEHQQSGIKQNDFRISSTQTSYMVDQLKLLTDEVNHLYHLAERIFAAEAEIERQREALKLRMENELKMARTVQETLYPTESAQYRDVQIAGHFEPASECGGDWWYHSEIKGKIIFCIGDATGHGAPAALITSAARSAMSIIENLANEPDKIVELMNKAIFDVSKGNVTMTLFLGVYDLSTRILLYCNASHEAPYLVKADRNPMTKGDLLPLWDVNNLRLGQNRNTVYSKAQIRLEKGDFIFFYTDGITDLLDESGLQLGERKFLKTLVSNLDHRENPIAFINSLRDNFNNFRKKDLVDDITYFCIKI